MELSKYQGAGNDFLLVDNRDGVFSPSATTISSLCDRHYGIGADGIILLETDPDHDFRMVYYNPDGTGGMMCGNGGRCIVAFAADLGILPKNGKTYRFMADDGLHLAEILDCDPELEDNQPATVPRPENKKDTVEKTIRLKMKNVPEVEAVDAKSFFLDTGTRHFVRFVSGLQTYDVVHEGREIRNLPQFAPIGTNVNFVEAIDGILNVRTYEKGVEDETCACGTGITASAIAALRYFSADPAMRAAVGQTIRRNSNVWEGNAKPAGSDQTAKGGRVRVTVKALKDFLAVDFIETASGAEDVWLTGPAAFVCKIMTQSTD